MGRPHRGFAFTSRTVIVSEISNVTQRWAQPSGLEMLLSTRKHLTEVAFEPCSDPVVPLPSIDGHFMYVTRIDDEFVWLLQA